MTFRPLYYSKLFPYPVVARWNDASMLAFDDMTYREFAMTVGDRWLRNGSFTDATDLARQVKYILPQKIHFGAIYPTNVRIPFDSPCLCSFQMFKGPGEGGDRRQRTHHRHRFKRLPSSHLL